MRNVKVDETIRGSVINSIMDACRDNSTRVTKRVGEYTVTFTDILGGEHFVSVYQGDSKLPIANAIVDQFDN